MSIEQRDARLAGLKARVDALYVEYIFPVLATVRVGEDAEAVRYEAELRDAAEAAGVILRRYILPADTEQTDIEGLIRQINADSLLSALLLVQPLPARMDAASLRTQIDPKKTVDADTCELLLQHVIDAAERNARP